MRRAAPLGEALILGSNTVAVIALDRPVDSAYAALVVRSDKGSVSTEEMTVLVRDRIGA